MLGPYAQLAGAPIGLTTSQTGRSCSTNAYKSIPEFGIRAVRYVDYRVALVGEIAIRFLFNLAQDSFVSYPKFT